MTLPGVDFAATVATDRQMTAAMRQKLLLRQLRADDVFAKRKLRQRQLARWTRNLGILASTLATAWAALALVDLEPTLHFGSNAHTASPATAEPAHNRPDLRASVPTPEAPVAPALSGEPPEPLVLRLDSGRIAAPDHSQSPLESDHEQH
jgi:hypothetical protein